MILTYCVQGKHNKVVQVVNMHTTLGNPEYGSVFSVTSSLTLLCMCSSFIARLAIS